MKQNVRFNKSHIRSVERKEYAGEFDREKRPEAESLFRKKQQKVRPGAGMPKTLIKSRLTRGTVILLSSGVFGITDK